jgi:hypothetical protein
MDTLPPPHLYSDPNERLLASAFPKPPPPLRVRAARGVARLSRREARRIGAWLRSTSSSLPLVLVCAGVGITIGGYWGAPSRAEPAVATATVVQAALREAPAPRAEVTPIPCATGASALDDLPVPSARSPRIVSSAQEAATPSRPLPERRTRLAQKGKKRGSSSGPPRARAKAVRARSARSAAKQASITRHRSRPANVAGLRAVIASQ